MPLFDYTCRDCGHRAEQLVKSHRDEPACPRCGSQRMERELAAFAPLTGGTRTFEAAPPCASCGDPRGAGACGLN